MTDLFERLSKVFRASVFRLTATALALFVLVAAALAGILFWQSNNVLTEQVLVGVRAEAELIRREAAKGPEALLQAVAAVSHPEGPASIFSPTSTAIRPPAT